MGDADLRDRWKKYMYKADWPGFGKFLVVAGFVLICILFMYESDLQNYILEYTSHVSNRDDTQFVQNFTSEMVLEQDFSCQYDFDFITLDFSDHDRRLSGKTIISVYEKASGKDVFYSEVENSEIRYGNPVKIEWDNGGKEYTQYGLKIISKDTKDTALGIYGYEAAPGEWKASLNGKETPYVVSIGMHSYTNIYYKLSIMILTIGYLSLLLTGILVYLFQCKIETIFLQMAIPFGICMILFLTNSVYDEGRHVNTVYHYSNVLLGMAGNDTEQTIAKRKIDVRTKEKTQYSGGSPVNEQAQTYWNMLYSADEPAENMDIVQVDISDNTVVGDSTIIEYLPGIVGMTLGRILGLNYFGLILLTKLFMFAFYILLCYYALRNAPVMKMTLAFVALLPMNLYQASGITYDGFTFAVGLLLFAFILKLWKEGLDTRQWILVGLCSFILGCCKAGVYTSLIMILLLVPSEKYKWKKWKTFLLILIIAALPILIHYVPVFINGFLRIPQSSGMSNSTGEFYNITFVIKYPFQFLEMVARTIIAKAEYYMGGILGYRTAWSNQPISWPVMVPFIVLLVISGIQYSENKFWIKITDRMLIAAILIVEVTALHAIFLRETSIYDNIINGFQGRYFLVFLPVLIMILRNQGVYMMRGSDRRIYCIYSMSLFVYLYFFIKMFMRD